MPRKSDPATAVLAYFESAPIDAADLVLTLSRAVMVRRHGTLARPKKIKLGSGRAPQAGTPAADSINTPPPPVAEKAAKAPRTRKPKDQALPGIQGPGPVSEVG